MDLLNQLLTLDWLNVSGWGVAIGLCFFMLRRFTSSKNPWLTWQQHTVLNEASKVRGDEYKEASEKKDVVIEKQADALADNAATLKVVDDFLKKVPVRRTPRPRTGDTGRVADPQAQTGA